MMNKKTSNTQKNKSNKENETQFQPPTHQSQFLINVLTWILVISSFLYFSANLREVSYVSVSYSSFKSELRNNNVESVSMKGEELLGEFRHSINSNNADNASIEKARAFKTFLPPIPDSDLLKLLEDNKVDFSAISASTPMWISIILSTAPWLILIAFFIYSGKMLRSNMSGGSAFGFSRSKAKRFEVTDVSKRYVDVAGLENAKLDLQEIVDYLKNPERFRSIGAKMPKGILMMGPPGCGKTLLAKATAGEAGVPFFSVSGSEFIEMYVGVGASRVRNMFEEAGKLAPALIFIDEIDSIGRVRGTGLGGGNDEREQTLNQILAEMDGFSSDKAVVVIAATNRPDVLDPALVRPGRFDRKLVLELPGRKARAEIIAIHARKVPLAKDVNLDNIAGETVGFSGADLENLVNEAALKAARENRKEVTHQDFESARDKVVMGNPSSEVLSDEEKQRVAFHEAGHAIVTFYSKGADPINKVSIIPRGRSLGMTEQTPKEDRHNYTQSYLEGVLKILLGGRCAEQLHFGEVSSGAADDLKRATQLARKMVTQFGMSERLGAVNLQQSEEHPFLGREIAEPKQFSEFSAQAVDEEVSLLIDRCGQQSKKLLEERKQQLSILANALLEKETVTGDELKKLLHEE